MHRAARRALASEKRDGELLPHRLWESYLARTCNVGSRMQAHNYNWLLESLGLIEWKKGKGGGVRVLASSYEGILFDAREEVTS